MLPNSDDEMANPYESPHELGTKRNGLFNLGVVLLLIAITMPILGWIGTITGMVFSFNELAEAGSPSSNSLAKGISFSLATTVFGLIVGGVAAILGGILMLRARAM